MEASFKFLLYMLGTVLLFLVAVVTITTTEHWFGITLFSAIDSIWEMSKLWISALSALYVMYLGVTAGLAVVGWLTAEKLVNEPNRFRPEPDENGEVADYKASKFGFFTDIEPGMMKIVVMMGGHFRYLIMDHPDYTFRGYTKKGRHLKRSSYKYWEVIKTPKGERDAHPVHFKTPGSIWDILMLPFSLPWWAWRRFVHKTSGYVFSGIYPFQMVFVYPIERFWEKTSGAGEIELKRIKDFTDFYFAKEFIFWFPVGSADTRDGANVRIFVMLTLKTVNAFKLAWHTTDDWSSRLLGSASSEINDVTRVRFLKSILASDDGVDKAKSALRHEILRLGDSKDGKLGKYGLRVIDVDTPDRSAPDNIAEAIDEEAKSAYLAKARVKLAESDAKATRLNSRAIRAGGNFGIFAARNETQVRTAKEAGDKAVVNIGATQDSDPLMAALLQETRHGGLSNSNRKKRSKKQ